MPCLMLLPNKPAFTVVNAGDAYPALTDTTKKELDRILRNITDNAEQISLT